MQSDIQPKIFFHDSFFEFLGWIVLHCDEFPSKGAVYLIMVQNIITRGYKISLILQLNKVEIVYEKI